MEAHRQDCGGRMGAASQGARLEAYAENLSIVEAGGHPVRVMVSFADHLVWNGDRTREARMLEDRHSEDSGVRVAADQPRVQRVHDNVQHRSH